MTITTKIANGRTQYAEWSYTFTATRRGAFDPVASSYYADGFGRVCVVVDYEVDQVFDTMAVEDARLHCAEFCRKWCAARSGTPRYPNGSRVNGSGYQVPR